MPKRLRKEDIYIAPGISRRRWTRTILRRAYRGKTIRWDSGGREKARRAGWSPEWTRARHLRRRDVRGEWQLPQFPELDGHREPTRTTRTTRTGATRSRRRQKSTPLCCARCAGSMDIFTRQWRWLDQHRPPTGTPTIPTATQRNNNEPLLRMSTMTSEVYGLISSF